MNGTPGHVFELTSIDKEVIENCTFKDLAYGATKENTTSFGGIGEWISQPGDINIVKDTNGTITVGTNVNKIKPPIE